MQGRFSFNLQGCVDMCLPAAYAAYAAYAAMAVSAAAAVVQAQDQKKTANAQTKMIEDGYTRDQFATQRQYAEQQAVSQEDLGQRQREHLIEEGRLKAIGAESGLQGVTNERIVQEEANNTDKDLATIEANRVRANESAHTQATAKQSAANVQLAGIKRPSALGTGLQIAGALGSTYAAAQAPTTKTPTTKEKP
jgi:hypothetical protein